MLRLILYSLRYWVSDMHVDGFRFDLAAVLARREGNLEKFGVSGPRLSGPGDLTSQSHRRTVGRQRRRCAGPVPAAMCAMERPLTRQLRDYWGAQAGIRDLATRLAGSRDVFARADQIPQSSVTSSPLTTASR